MSLLMSFYFKEPAPFGTYTLSLHDALPIYMVALAPYAPRFPFETWVVPRRHLARFEDAGPRELASLDRKSTRLNSSHGYISYAVFCLKKKNTTANIHSCDSDIRTAQRSMPG